MILHVVLLSIIAAYGVYSLREVNAPSEKADTLELVHVLFRHGQRTPDISTIYPKDPYANETFYPYGLGSLTNEGKRTQFNLGRALRQRYNDFLGHIYTPELLDVQASPIRRTRMSAQLVLASLFQPSNIEKWNAHLNWQPIDFEYKPAEEDLLFLYLRNCPRYIEAVRQRNRQVLRSGTIGSFGKLFDYLSSNTGWNVTSLEQLFLLHNCLSTEQELGFELPTWTEKVFPEPLKSLSTLYWQYSTDTDILKTLSGGFLLKRIVEDTQNKIVGAQTHQKRKMVLYSGHDYTIVALLSTLGVFKSHNPPYGSYVLIEVHRMMNGYGLEVFYHDYSSKYPQLLQLPGCEALCPFEDFLTLYSKYLPTPDMCKLS